MGAVESEMKFKIISDWITGFTGYIRSGIRIRIQEMRER